MDLKMQKVGQLTFMLWDYKGFRTTSRSAIQSLIGRHDYGYSGENHRNGNPEEKFTILTTLLGDKK